MRWPLFLFGLVSLVLAVGCRSSQPQPSTTAPQNTAAMTTLPTTPDACRECNGEWGRHGLAQKDSCACRTKDAGKPCKSKRDCESQCVAGDPAETEIVDKGPPAKGFFIGHCHEFVPYFGCGRLLRNAAAPVPLDEPPAKTCID